MVRTACLSSLLLLGACASFYPSLYTPPATMTVSDVLSSAATLQQEYADGYKKAAQAIDLSSLPLIGAAAAAASILVFGDNGDDALAAIGIGTAAYTAGRATAAPTSMPDTYAKGHDALGCVRAEGGAFTGADALAERDAFKTKVDALAAAIAAAEATMTNEALPARASDEDRRRFTATLTSLAAAIATGKSLRDAGNRELLDFRGAAPVFAAAVSSIATRVATRGREGRVVDFATLRGQFTAGVTAAGFVPPPPEVGASAGGPPAAPTPPQRTPLQNLTDALNALVNANQEVAGGSPGYTAALQRVAACPTRAS